MAWHAPAEITRNAACSRRHAGCFYDEIPCALELWRRLFMASCPWCSRARRWPRAAGRRKRRRIPARGPARTAVAAARTAVAAARTAALTWTAGQRTRTSRAIPRSLRTPRTSRPRSRSTTSSFERSTSTRPAGATGASSASSATPSAARRARARPIGAPASRISTWYARGAARDGRPAGAADCGPSRTRSSSSSTRAAARSASSTRRRRSSRSSGRSTRWKRRGSC